MNHPVKKTRLCRVLLVYGFASAALLGYVLLFASTGWGFPCLLNRFTGLECGGCGMTRAAVAVLELNLSAAFSYHALWPIFPGYFLWIALSDARVYVETGDIQLLPGKWWIHAAVLAAIVGYGILRNVV